MLSNVWQSLLHFSETVSSVQHHVHEIHVTLGDPAPRSLHIRQSFYTEVQPQTLNFFLKLCFSREMLLRSTFIRIYIMFSILKVFPGLSHWDGSEGSGTCFWAWLTTRVQPFAHVVEGLTSTHTIVAQTRNVISKSTWDSSVPVLSWDDASSHSKLFSSLESRSWG